MKKNEKPDTLLALGLTATNTKLMSNISCQPQKKGSPFGL